MARSVRASFVEAPEDRMLSVQQSYEYAARLTKAEAKNFFYTFRFLPPHRRQSIFAVYAFSRRADDAVDAVEDQTSTAEQAAADLEFLRSLLYDSPPDDPLSQSLRHTIQRFSIPIEPFEELLAGMAMDLHKKRYLTFDELYEYCYRAASVVGLICIKIFGYESQEAVTPAIKLGIAMQLTNIIRDVAEDRERGRIYLPQEDFERFGCIEEDLQGDTVNTNFRELIRFQVDRARRFFQEAGPLFPLVHSDSRYCPVLLMRFYSRILDRIEKANFDVLSQRPSLPTHEKLWLAGTTWLNRTANSWRS